MKKLEPATVLIDMSLPHFSIDRSGDALDESSLEKLFQDLENFLQDVLLLCIVVAVFLFTEV